MPISKLLGTNNIEEELLKPIKENINNTEAINLYADHLLSKGDPYGEWLMLSIGIKGKKPKKAILNRMNELNQSLDKFNGVPSTRIIKNGFLTEISLMPLINWIELGGTILSKNPLLNKITLEIDRNEQNYYNLSTNQLNNHLDSIYKKHNRLFPQIVSLVPNQDDAQQQPQEWKFIKTLFNHKITEGINNFIISGLSFYDYLDVQEFLKTRVFQTIKSLNLEQAVLFQDYYMMTLRKYSNLEELDIRNTGITYMSLELFTVSYNNFTGLKKLHISSDEELDYDQNFEDTYDMEDNSDAQYAQDRYNNQGINIKKLVRKINQYRPNLKILVDK